MTEQGGSHPGGVRPWLLAAVVGAGWAVVSAAAIYLGVYWSVGGSSWAIWAVLAVLAVTCLALGWWLAGRLGAHPYRGVAVMLGIALVLQVAAVSLGVGLSPLGALGLFAPFQAVCLVFALAGVRLPRG